MVEKKITWISWKVLVQFIHHFEFEVLLQGSGIYLIVICVLTAAQRKGSFAWSVASSWWHCLPFGRRTWRTGIQYCFLSEKERAFCSPCRRQASQMVYLPYFPFFIYCCVWNICFGTTRIFKHAERINASRLILVGNSEWERGMVRVKILSTREEFEVKAGELEWLFCWL